MAVALEFESVAKAFVRGERSVVALEEATFAVDEGEFVVVIGPSGCGKSTLLNMAAGLMAPTRGVVRYAGKPITSVNTDVGYVTQSDSLMSWRTVVRNVELALEIQGVERRERRERVRAALERVGVADFADHYPSELSGGMRKRVSLARTLVYKPRVLLMDEPFAALDAQLRIIMHRELSALCRESGTTVLFVTHDLDEAITLADRIVVISSRPGTVRLIEPVNVNRSTDDFATQLDEEFVRLKRLLWNALENEVLRSEKIDAVA